MLHDELEKIWNPKEYPVELHSKLLELMERFELAFELRDKESHLVAELLPSTELDFAWTYENNLRFYYHSPVQGQAAAELVVSMRSHARLPSLDPYIGSTIGSQPESLGADHPNGL